MTNPYPGGQRATPGLTATGAPLPAPTASASATASAVAAVPSVGTNAPAPGTAAAAAAPSGTAAPRLIRNTPRLLARLRAAVVVTSLLFAALCVAGTILPYGSLSGARSDIEHGQRLRSAQTSLARTEALAAEAADPKVNGDPTAFRKEADALSAALVTAAAAYPSDAVALSTVAGQVSSYRAAVDLGLAQRSSDAVRAQAAIASANTAVNATAMTSLRGLTTAVDNRLPSRFTMSVAPLVVAAAILAVVTALIGATFVALRTRRVLNPGLAAAVVALLLALGLASSAAGMVTGGADVATGPTLSAARAAAETQGLVELARTAQLTGTADGKSWAQISPLVRERLDTLSLTSASAAWSQAEAAQAKGDLPGTRTAIDKVTALMAPLATSSTEAATASVAFERVLVYGAGAALLAILAALLASWGIGVRLNEYH